jgi:hypothetical protein
MDFLKRIEKPEKNHLENLEKSSVGKRFIDFFQKNLKKKFDRDGIRTRAFRLVPKTSALDHSATLPLIKAC